MDDDKTINLEERRRAQSGPNRNRETDRAKEAHVLLEKLASTKRLTKEDQLAVVQNIGAVILQLAPKGRSEFARTVLTPEQFQKRKRYVRFPDDDVTEVARSAGSGGDFSAIIRKITRVKSDRGFDSSQALIDVVFDVLRGTSFRGISRFHMSQRRDDAVVLARTVSQVLDKFAEDTNLAQYLETISKYPVHPNMHRDGWTKMPPLSLRPEYEPDELYRWDQSLEEDEIQNYIPWWAPKCVIGHLYIPFECKSLEVKGDRFLEIQRECDGNIERDTWEKNMCSSLLLSPVATERAVPESWYHRLPVWITILPSLSQLACCLFASVSYEDEFQLKMSLNAEGTYFTYRNMVDPCFVTGFGDSFGADNKLFEATDYDEDTPFYVCALGDRIYAIGGHLDEDIENFKESFGFAWGSEEFPPWLHPHPVQMILKLAANSIATNFVLSPRIFPKNLLQRRYTRGIEAHETLFRPSFSNPVDELTPNVRQNSIAAYLLRNFAETRGSSIFAALKSDAMDKAKAVQDAIDPELLKFRETFENIYGSER